MKKIPRHKKSSIEKQVEPDVAILIKEMQQQLVSLERKIDALSSNSSEKPFPKKHFSDSFRSFDRSHHGHRKGRQGDSFRERSFTQAVCAECNKECEVPFKPSGDRPVYCSECFSKRNQNNSFGMNRNNGPREGHFSREHGFDKSRDEGNRGGASRKKPFFKRGKSSFRDSGKSY